MSSQPAVMNAGRAAPRREKFSPIVLILIALLLAMILPPIIHLIETSFYTTKPDGSFGEFTTRYYYAIFENPRFMRYLINTTIFALGSAVLAILLGVGQAWIVERTDTPFRQYVFLISIISLGIPQVLNTISWLLILGKSGPFNAMLKYFTGSPEAVFEVYNIWGMVVIEGISWTPLAFLLMSSVFRAADASFEEASVMSGATVGQTFRHITVKLAMPAVLALAMLVVIRAFEAFEIPALVGLPGNVYVLATDIYDSVHRSIPPNYGQAGAFSVGLLLIVVLMLYYYNRLSRHAERYQTITGKGYRPRIMHLGKLRYVTGAILIVFFFLIIVLPLLMLLWASFLPYHQHFSFEAISTLTTKNYANVFRSQSLRGSVANTLILSTATALLTSGFSAICAWYAVRRYRGGWLLDQLATAPLIFPAIVLGVALLQVYLQLPFPFYGTLASIVVACFIRDIPYGMRYSYAGILQIHTELEEASAISGARQLGTFVRIVVPLVAPALVTCSLFVFLLTSRAVSLPILLVGPDSHVVAVTIFEMWQNGQITELAAMGIVWMVFMTFVSSAFYVIAKRYGLTVR
jgi:iron(III) transport system permease protein